MALDADTLSQLLETIRSFVDERLIPAEAEVAETDVIPESIVADMRALGLFGLTAPEVGGLGLTMEEEVLAIFELGGRPRPPVDVRDQCRHRHARDRHRRHA
jgi:acyl-CoA dehydrogenase